MVLAAESIVQGLTFGSLYALVAMSFNLLYRPTNVFNFAQGELVMAGAMVTATVAAGASLPWLPAAALAALAVAGLCLAEERVAIRPVVRRSSSSVGWVITTLAASLIMADVAGKVWDDTPRVVDPPAGLSLAPFDLLGVRVNSYQLAIVGLAVVVAWGLHALDRTRVGLAVRAVAEDRDAAMLQGVNPTLVSRIAFVLGGLLAGLTGAVAAPLVIATITMGFPLLIKGFATVAVGGIGNNRGALVAGWMLGIVESAGATTLSPGLQTTVLFLVMLVVLVVRPHGLFGQSVARHV